MSRRTSMVCPQCKQLSVHRVRRSARYSGVQKSYRMREVGVQEEDGWPTYFARLRVCESCGHKWKSAELPLDFVQEVLLLLEQSRSINASNSEAYAESKKQLGTIKAKVAACSKLTQEKAELLKDILALLPPSLEEALAAMRARTLARRKLLDSLRGTPNSDQGEIVPSE